MRMKGIQEKIQKLGQGEGGGGGGGGRKTIERKVGLSNRKDGINFRIGSMEYFSINSLANSSESTFCLTAVIFEFRKSCQELQKRSNYYQKRGNCIQMVPVGSK